MTVLWPNFDPAQFSIWVTVCVNIVVNIYFGYSRIRAMRDARAEWARHEATKLAQLDRIENRAETVASAVPAIVETVEAIHGKHL